MVWLICAGLIPGPQAFAGPGVALVVGATGGSGPGQDAPAAPAPGERLPTNPAHASGGNLSGSAPVESHDPDLEVVRGGIEESPGARTSESIIGMTHQGNRVQVGATGPVREGHLIWALGLAGAALGWLMTRARWCGGLVATPSRGLVRLGGGVKRRPEGRG